MKRFGEDMSKKTVYWLSRQISLRAKQKIEVLSQSGFKVLVVKSVTELNRKFPKQRALSIIVGDGGDLVEVKSNIKNITEDPEYGSIRLVLSVSSRLSKLPYAAMDYGFRDIIPLDFSDKLWLRKFLFAVGLNNDFGPALEPSLTMHQMATANIPSRASWISASHIWIESRLNPKVGSNLQLKGTLAAQLGVKSISLQVEKKFNTHLHYRYSEALLCRWSIPTKLNKNKQLLLKLLSEHYSTKPIYVFMGMSSGIEREKIKRALNRKNIHLHLALQKKSLVDEPKYISPDVMILDYKLASGRNSKLFDKILRNLPKKPTL